MEKRRIYSEPEVVVMEFVSERGFATSDTGGYTDSMDYEEL